MSMLWLALALVTPAPTVAVEERPDDRVTCSVNVHALDGQGQARSARRVSASVASALVFRGRRSSHAREMEEEATPTTLVFDVFNPRGQRYQILVATPRVVTSERNGQPFVRAARTQEAALAVAGSSIAWTSMYGTWRVEPRLEGAGKPCGRAEFFTILP